MIIGGIAYIKVFSKIDPRYTILKKHYNEIEADTFYIEERDLHVTYFDKGEILNLFNDTYEIICCKEEYSLDFGHDDKHYHGNIEIMVKKVIADLIIEEIE